MNNNKFKKNFWKDFKKILKVRIDNLEDIDFSLIKKYLDDQSEKRKNMSKEEKLRIKKKNDADEEPQTECEMLFGSNFKHHAYLTVQPESKLEGKFPDEIKGVLPDDLFDDLRVF